MPVKILADWFTATIRELACKLVDNKNKYLDAKRLRTGARIFILKHFEWVI